MNDSCWYAVIDSYKQILGIFPTAGEAEHFMYTWNNEAREIGDVTNKAESIKPMVLEFTSYHFVR